MLELSNWIKYAHKLMGIVVKNKDNGVYPEASGHTHNNDG